MNMFIKAQKPLDSTPSITWDDRDLGIAEGKKVFKGMVITGKFVELQVVDTTDMNTGEPTKSNLYKIHLYENHADPELFSKEPDGDIVKVWGKKNIDESFSYGEKGEGIQLGDIVQFTCNGKKKTKNGKYSFWDIEVSFFRTKKTLTPATAPVAPKTSAPSVSNTDEY